MSPDHLRRIQDAVARDADRAGVQQSAIDELIRERRAEAEREAGPEA